MYFKKNESGSTILEVLVALAVLSLLGMGAWHAVGVSLRLAARLRDRVISSSRLLLLDDRLRELARRVRPPFWAPDHFVENADGRLGVPYLDGDPAQSLLLEYQGGILTVIAGGATTRYADFQSATFSAMTNEQALECGIFLQLRDRTGQSTTVIARFGGTPITGSVNP